MKTKTLLFLGTVVLTLSCAAVATLYVLQRNHKLPENLAIFPINNSPMPTPIPTEPPFTLGKFIIFPETFAFTDADIKFIKEQGYHSLLIETENDEITAKVKALFPETKVYALTSKETAGNISKCKNPEPAESGLTANQSREFDYYISKDQCNKSKKLSNLIENSCKASDNSCITFIQQNLHEDAYLYLPQAPFITSFSAPSLTIDTTTGIVIPQWTTLYPNTKISQAAYSLEYKDLQGKRIHATGKISMYNMGDWFIPTSDISAQPLTVLLRIWYSFDGVTSTTPEQYTTTFAYDKPAWTPSVTPVVGVEQSSWIPEWGMTEGRASVVANPKKWSTIMPVWFVPNADGTLNIKPTYNDKVLVKTLRDNGVKLVPTISLFDADILRPILREHMDKHIEEIVRQVSANNYDGIDIDYESTYRDDRELLNTFLRKLKAELSQRGKILSFTVMHKIDDRKIYSFLPQTHEAQDWKAIGEIVDEFRIMAYDFTGQGSLQPGPISPYMWNEALIRYAVQNVPKEKVILALPLYSHAWPKPKNGNLAGENNDQNLYSGLLKNTLSWQHKTIAYVKKNSSYYRETYDNWNQEVRVELKYNGVERVMYYLDKRAIDARIELAKKYGIKGVCYWRIGDEIL